MYATRSKQCATCYAAERRNEEPPPHNCRKNFSKSSKAMEADAIVEIAKDLQDAGVKIAVMVGDDESSAIKKLREECSGDIQKLSDLNPVKKNLGNPLYALKAKGHGELSDKVIKYVQKSFVYAVNQNKNNPAGLHDAFSAMVRHMYGDHDGCNDRGCGYRRSPSTYRQKGLPDGNDLSNDRCTKLF